jgi:hypothetical protein
MADDEKTDKRISTGEREAISQAAANAVVAAMKRQGETPQPNESTSMARKALDWFECEKMGPAYKLGQRDDDIEKEIETMKLAKATEDGANREIAREAGKYGALRMAVVSAALSTAVGLGLFALNRVFPPMAHAQPSQVQK